MTKFLWLAFVLHSSFALTAFASGSHQWLTPDFFLEKNPYATQFKSLDEPMTSCRENIRKVMCLVDPGPADGDFGMERPCLEGGKAYAHFFEELYDHYPPALQKLFCSLQVIYIEKAFFGTAYAGVIKDSSGKTVGAKMGIRKSVLDEQLNLSTWASWKEQLSFGGNSGSYEITSGLPFIQTHTDAPVNDFLYFVIAHEFGHIFDFANDLNRYTLEKCAEEMDKDPSKECEMHPDSWGALTWLTDKTARPENEFTHRKDLCFYWCKEKTIDPAFTSQLYKDLDRSSFISIYATTQPWDDFADSLAYYLVSENLKASYLLQDTQGNSYDIMAKLQSPQFSKKREYLKAFMSRTDIQYP